MITPEMRKRIDILLVDDGSGYFLSPVNFVKDLPISSSSLPKSTITLLSIVDPKLPYDHRVAEAVLEQMQLILKDKNMVLETRIEAGHLEEKVIKIARQINPDLIVMRGHKHSIISGDPIQQETHSTWGRLHWPVLKVNRHYKAVRNVLLITGPVDRACASKYLSKIPFPQKSEVQVMKLLPQSGAQIYSRDAYPKSANNVCFTPGQAIDYLESHSFDLIVTDDWCLKKLFTGYNHNFLNKLRNLLSHSRDPFARCSLLIIKGRPKPIAEGCGSEEFQSDARV